MLLLNVFKFEQENAEEISLPLNDEITEYNTLAGYVLGKLGHFPHTGEIINLDKYQIAVTRMDGKRIDQLQLTVPNKNQNQETDHNL